MLRIHQVISDGMLDKYMFDDATHKEIITFIEVNKNQLRDLSLRMVGKIADLRCSFPDTWMEIAQMTCMRHK